MTIAINILKKIYIENYYNYGLELKMRKIERKSYLFLFFWFLLNESAIKLAARSLPILRTQHKKKDIKTDKIRDVT